MTKFLLPVLLLLFFSQANAQTVFHWKWQPAGSQLTITGRINNGREKEITADLATVKKRFNRLYAIIDEIEYPRMNEYLRTVDTLSSQLISPFSKELEQCQSIIIEMDSSLLRMPVEFLAMNDTAMGLFRPMAFTINGYTGKETSDSITLYKGFIIRDKTSDPENACRTTLNAYPGSIFKKAATITMKDLTVKPGIDFILISAHGDADSLTLRGGIALNKIDNVAPAIFKENNPRLLYIDGCQQGINWTYISALVQTPAINYYTGPVISNDSGESSTKTINWFFAYLKESHNPVIALWKTRIKLYNHYNKKINAMDVINKSFIFRMYKI